MTLSTDDILRDPIVTDDDVLERVDRLIGRACRRQLWLLFTDDDDRQLPIVMPLEDYPPAPYEGNAALLADRLRQVMDATDAARVILVWERRLGPATMEADRAWARELAAACEQESVPVRAQLISHRDGTRWFAPDDYL